MWVVVTCIDSFWVSVKHQLGLEATPSTLGWRLGLPLLRSIIFLFCTSSGKIMAPGPLFSRAMAALLPTFFLN